MHSTRVLAFAIVVSALAGFFLRAESLPAYAASPDERITQSIDKVSGQLRELTRAVQSADRTVECRCK